MTRTVELVRAPEMLQDRNEYDLMCDFADEVQGYLRNVRHVSRLRPTKRSPGGAAGGDNLLAC